VRPDRIWAVARKDMSSARRHRYVLYGLVAIPLLFSLFIPLVSLYPVVTGEEPSENELPPFAQPGLSPRQAVVAGTIHLSLLMFLVLPAVIPSTIASYTFVGEKVNRQLEPLLATPLTDLELLLGKILGALVPSLLVTALSFAGFVITVDLLTHPLFGHPFLPDLLSLLVVGVYSPLVCLLSVSLCVLISSRVSDVRAAMQLGALSVLPALALYLLFAGGIVGMEGRTLLAFGLVLGLASAGLFSLARATFRREEILIRWR